MTEKDNMMGESDLRVLVEAAKIQRDPKRMAAAMKAKKQMVAGLKSVGGKNSDPTKGTRT